MNKVELTYETLIEKGVDKEDTEQRKQRHGKIFANICIAYRRKGGYVMNVTFLFDYHKAKEIKPEIVKDDSIYILKHPEAPVSASIAKSGPMAGTTEYYILTKGENDTGVDIRALHELETAVEKFKQEVFRGATA